MIFVLALLALLGCSPEGVRSGVPELFDLPASVARLTGCPGMWLPPKSLPVPEPPEWEVQIAHPPPALARFSVDCGSETWLPALDETHDEDVDRDKFE